MKRIFHWNINWPAVSTSLIPFYGPKVDEGQGWVLVMFLYRGLARIGSMDRLWRRLDSVTRSFSFVLLGQHCGSEWGGPASLHLLAPQHFKTENYFRYLYSRYNASTIGSRFPLTC